MALPVPGQMAIVWLSPQMNEAGNSVRAARAINHIVNEPGLNMSGSGTLSKAEGAPAHAGAISLTKRRTI